MTNGSLFGRLDRRSLLKAAAAAGIAQVASPFILSARADETVKIGLDNPLTGTYAALGKNEQIGAQLAVDQINAQGGILGRQVELLVEDSTSGDAATAVQKATKLVERDKVNFLLGNINSALAQAMANYANEKGVLHIVPGGHVDTVTGTQCHWNVFRVCNTTRMETNSVSKLLLSSYGKKWYFITTDYAFGHGLQAGFEASLNAAGGTKLGGDLTPLSTTDFSANLIKAQSTSPDAIVLLLAGDDMINCLKQAVQFGLNQKTHIAGAQQELEVLMGLPPEALIGDWVFEWYWNQPGVPHVEQFVADIRKVSGGKVPTARTWFGYASVQTCKLAAEAAKSLETAKMAKAMQGLELPPEIALMPNKAYYREGDNQLMPTLFVGSAQQAPSGGDPADLFKVSQLVKGDEAALPIADTGCKMTWPS
ncbi:ABC transporter substrate-binding protein [Hypericibacter adhaerens]|jgi:branched-chain amino acid transport system substrate-binding protein|uniref:ABC transporter substrate-binding protein n=1 Tax=Hypericibacter adhaerens TaxID=2602016 RepID=UPI001247A46E|nr:ABC transporter substrate-binding protein [Hypericibacter adhaerens]